MEEIRCPYCDAIVKNGVCEFCGLKVEEGTTQQFAQSQKQQAPEQEPSTEQQGTEQAAGTSKEDGYQYHGQGQTYDETLGGNYNRQNTQGNPFQTAYQNATGNGAGSATGEKKEPFYQNQIFIFALLFFFAPAGIALMWFFKKFTMQTRIILTVFFGMKIIMNVQSLFAGLFTLF